MTVCAACGAAALRHFHTEPGVPVNSCLLVDDRDEARNFPRGTIDLALCDGCGFVMNTSFDPALAEYSSRYEETQGYSARFQQFARELAKRWVDDYDLHGRRVLEIGCGKGEFLTYMAEAGIGHGIGIDPGVKPERIDSPAGDRLTWIADFFSAGSSHLTDDADAIVCRHTLEHLPDVAGFMTMLRRAIGDRRDTVVLFELPDVLRVLQEVAFWDVYYEHCSYFSAGSLARLFRRCGFEVLDVRPDYDDQYLLIEARPAVDPQADVPLSIEDDMAALRTAALRFGRRYPSQLHEWRRNVEAVRSAGGDVVIWGGGSKGVSYLGGLGLDGVIRYAVDINPHKQGRYMAGSGTLVVAPSFLRQLRPALVVAMNPIYVDEIRNDLDRLGVAADLVAV